MSSLASPVLSGLIGLHKVTPCLNSILNILSTYTLDKNLKP